MDYYQILGVNRDADAKEIKKQYRKLALKYHPDKFTNKSKSEQADAAKKMSEINEAYAVLGDEKKKAQYDSGGFSDGFNPFENSGFDEFYHGFNGFGDFDRAFADFFKDKSNTNKQSNKDYRDMHGTDIRMQIPLSIKDIMYGTTKKVKFKKNVRCHSCHGTGGTGKMTCPYCHGTGEYVSTQHNGFMTMQQIITCPHCGGKGYKIQHVCPTCHGTGFEPEETILSVTFPAGVKEGDSQILMFMGNESKDSEGSNGRFIAVPYYKYDSNIYDLSHFPDIHQRINVNWIDALLGTKLKVDTPISETKKEIEIPECSKNGAEIRLKKKGITINKNQAPNGIYEPFMGMRGNIQTGDYVFDINYVMPDKLSDKQKDLLNQIKNS